MIGDPLWFDPESTMADFEARRTSVANTPGRRLSGGRVDRQRRAGSVESGPPPFGTRRGDRVVYSVELPRELVARLDELIDPGVPGRSTFGELAVTAIRSFWHASHVEVIDITDGLFEPPTDDLDNAVASRPVGELDRTRFYITAADAEAIELVRLQFGRCELETLHVMAFEAMVDPDDRDGSRRPLF